jgi:hypothetical protein
MGTPQRGVPARKKHLTAKVAKKSRKGRQDKLSLVLLSGLCGFSSRARGSKLFEEKLPVCLRMITYTFILFRRRV